VPLYLVSSAISSFVASAATNPFDFAKSRIMANVGTGAGAGASAGAGAGYGNAHQPQQQAQYTTPQVPPGMGLDAEQRMFMPMPYMTPYGYPYDEGYYLDQYGQPGAHRGKSQVHQRSPNERPGAFPSSRPVGKKPDEISGQAQGPVIGQMGQAAQPVGRGGIAGAAPVGAPNAAAGPQKANPAAAPSNPAYKPALNKGFPGPQKKPYAPAPQQGSFPQQYMHSMYSQYGMYPQYLQYYQSPQYPPGFGGRSTYFQSGPYQGYPAYPEEYQADPAAAQGNFESWEGGQPAGAPIQDNMYRPPANAGGQPYPYGYPQPQFAQPYPEAWGQYPQQH